MSSPRISFHPTFPGGEITAPFKWLAVVDQPIPAGWHVDFRVDAQLGGDHLKTVSSSPEAFPPFQCNGDPDGLYDPSGLFEGSHAFGVVLRDANGKNVSNVRVYRNVKHIVVPPPPPPPPGTDPGTPDRSLAAWLGALPSGIAVKEIKTLSEWQQSWPPGNGQMLDVTSPLALPALRSTKRYTDWAACRFTSGVTFSDGWYVEGDMFATFGGLIPKATQHGLHGTNLDDVRIWGLQVGGCGATGALIHANVGPVTAGFDLEFTVTRCGQNVPVYDPHGEPGTGVHPWYIGSDDYGHGGVQGTYVLHGYDCPTGAGQLGNALHNATLWLQGERFTKVATSQVAGNLVQLWGGGCHDITVKRAIGKDMAGRMVETDALGSSTRNVVVEYARGTAIRLSPLYTAHADVTYKHVG